VYLAVSFDVEVDDTAAANLCSLFGQYRLVLTNEHATLVDASDRPVLNWQYRSTNLLPTHTGHKSFTDPKAQCLSEASPGFHLRVFDRGHAEI